MGCEVADRTLDKQAGRQTKGQLEGCSGIILQKNPGEESQVPDI
jgi:hypothetical protein